MLWQFLASAMKTAGHASMRGFKVETWSLNRKGHPDYIIFCRIGRKHSDDRALTFFWRFCTLFSPFLGSLMPLYFLVTLEQLHSDELRTRPVSHLSVRVIKQVTWHHFGTCTWVQWLKNLGNPGTCCSSDFTLHWRHSLYHENKALNRYQISHIVKHNEVAEILKKHCTIRNVLSKMLEVQSLQSQK